MDKNISTGNAKAEDTALDTTKEDQSQTPVKERKTRTLFVRSLPATATTESLTEHFSQSYPLKHATVVLDPQTKQSKGYGFVTFTDHEDAELAAKELNNSVLEGKKIKIELAEPRHREIDEKEGKSVPSSAPSKVKELKDKRKQEALPPKLIIRNLPWSVTEPEHLELLFRSYGKIKHAVVPKKGTRVAGFGFVVMRGRKNAERAIEGVNGKEVDGRTLAVDWAVDKNEWDSMNNAAEEAAEKEDGGDSEEAEEKEHLDVVDDGESDVDSEEDGGVELGDENEDDDISMGDAEDDDLEEDEEEPNKEDDRNASTIFIRNLPFSATDESLHEHFTQFGPIRYARVVLDPATERPRGTAFVCFYNADDAASCIRGAPRETDMARGKDPRQKAATRQMHSVLEDENNDPSGKYTMDGRVLQVSQAVSRTEAGRLEEEGNSRRETRDHDKRRLFLLSEGTIPSNSPAYSKLSETERKMREASAKQRQKLIKSNPMLHVSLTRLSVRNLPRHIDSKALKALAREAVVGFAKDVKNGLRKPISWEESRRSAALMKEADQLRKSQKKGIVKQAKVVFEGKDGAKTSDQSGAGRSRGYGFIEYATHRSSLMGLRWLNGHAIEASASTPNADPADRKKRLIVEFALENAQVVNRRREREANTRKAAQSSGDDKTDGPRGVKRSWDGKGEKRERGGKGHKSSFKGMKDFKNGKGGAKNDKSDRKSARAPNKAPSSEKGANGEAAGDKDKDIAKRNRIIARKRMLRRNRK
ncbi:ribosome biogenesis protein Nop4 [Arthroderma uncinatum]|uniref:ribosome biogenesis protein Nop4 n=1 Tax=Arthroderma uncinatum TaxID=74035 RepID=UPI00144A6864|nr:ribosome biogenesis protein Nop4 [Arthroderma uncinatum]KAF3492003.1 ribosome biogenesis protein Nop4 [Arthroderma uncinatum]